MYPFVCPSVCQFIHSSVHPSTITHATKQSASQPAIHSFHSSIPTLIRLSTIRTFTHSRSFIHSSVRLSVRSFVYLFVRSFLRPCLHSFIRPLVCSFIRLSVRPDSKSTTRRDDRQTSGGHKSADAVVARCEPIGSLLALLRGRLPRVLRIVGGIFTVGRPRRVVAVVIVGD